MNKDKKGIAVNITAGMFIVVAILNVLVFFSIINSGWRTIGFGVVIFLNVIQIIVKNSYMTQSEENEKTSSRINIDKADLALLISTSLLWLVTYVITGF